jgi:hypothetical protein
MQNTGVITLDLILDKPIEGEINPHNDSSLVYPGKLYKMQKARSACIGRVLPPQDRSSPAGSRVPFVIFQFHGPSSEASKVLASIPDDAAPVIARLDGIFYLMDKSEALQASGALENAV